MGFFSDTRLYRKTRSGSERPFFCLPASGSIDDKTNIACFAVFARQKNSSLSGLRRSFPTEPRTIDCLLVGQVGLAFFTRKRDILPKSSFSETKLFLRDDQNTNRRTKPN